MHEGYAEPAELTPAHPLIVSKQPPAPIQEMPPDIQPEGYNVVWLPGYWGWDDTANDFIWISGIWRNAPPGQAWVPGYWASATGGFQWVPGFWTSASQNQVSYLPEPPQSLERGPTTPAPSPNDFWVPGNFHYTGSGYVWRPGYWTAARTGWIWQPAQYAWTPNGFILTGGYWDYSLARRGMIFAPVQLAPSVYANANFVWYPTIVIDPAVLLDSFFVRDSYWHYYFGDCFGDQFTSLGIQPFFAVGATGYDPLLTYYSWFNGRNNADWLGRLRQRYDYDRAHPEFRPPRTFAEMSRARPGVEGGAGLALSLRDYTSRVSASATVAPGEAGPVRFTQLTQPQRQTIARDAFRGHDIARERGRVELQAHGRPATSVAGAAESESGIHFAGRRRDAARRREGRELERRRNRSTGRHAAAGRATQAKP